MEIKGVEHYAQADGFEDAADVRGFESEGGPCFCEHDVEVVCEDLFESGDLGGFDCHGLLRVWGCLVFYTGGGAGVTGFFGGIF